jgi:CobQ-like glutamine amidotransferase family enzyme
MKNLNVVFIGGGPDSGQKQMYKDLLEHKGGFLREYIQGGGVGLYICGSYQLLGNYYKASDGSVLQGLGIFDLYTQHFGPSTPRCIGNVVAKLSATILADSVFKAVNTLDDKIVGFENHGGRTFLGTGSEPFALVQKGFGNNGVDHTEGVLYKNSIGSYFHGPLLSKNAHVADYLIAKGLGLSELQPLDDTLVRTAHFLAQKLHQ